MPAAGAAGQSVITPVVAEQVPSAPEPQTKGTPAVLSEAFSPA